MISSKLVVGAALLGALVVAVGCDGGADTIAPPPSPFETEQGFCAVLAEASCTQAVVENCYLSDASDAEQFQEDTEACRAAAAKPSVCNPQNYTYRSEGAQACVDAVGLAYADGKLTLDEIKTANEACLAVYSGNKGVGSPCTADHECKFSDGLTCVAEVGKEATCQVAEVVAPGGSCGNDAQLCEEGYYCTAVDQVCGQEAGVGDTCSETRPCEEGALCGAGGTCEPKAKNGAACTDPTECEGGFCVKAQGASEGTCGSTVTLSPTNEGTCSAFLP